MFKKMKSLFYRRVFVRNPNTSKEIVQFVHEVHLVFAVTVGERSMNFKKFPTLTQDLSMEMYCYERGECVYVPS